MAVQASRGDTSNVIHVDFGRGARAPAEVDAPVPAPPPEPRARAPRPTPPSPFAAAPSPGTAGPAQVFAAEAAPAPRRQRALGPVQTKKRDPTGDLFVRAEVSRLFGIPESRLRYWDRTGFLAPSGETDGKRLYTFQDLIGVRAAKSLLERGTPLRRVRRSVESLKETLPHVIRPLAELRISAEGDKLLVHTERAK